jgi:hypothetical protein
LESEVVLNEQGVFRLRLGDDRSTIEKCLEALRELQEKISEVHLGSHEVFDFGLYVGGELEDIREHCPPTGNPNDRPDANLLRKRSICVATVDDSAKRSPTRFSTR